MATIFTGLSSNISAGETAPVQLVLMAGMTPVSNNLFKFNISSSPTGITTNIGDTEFYYDSSLGSTLPFTLTVPVDYPSESCTLTLTLFEKINNQWVEVATDITTYSLSIFPISWYRNYLNSSYGNSTLPRWLGYGSSPALPSYASANGLGYSHTFWYGQKSTPMYFSVNTPSSNPATIGTTLDFSPYSAGYANDMSAFFEAGSWSTSVALTDSIIGPSGVTRLYTYVTPVTKSDMTYTWTPGQAIYSSYFQPMIVNTGYSTYAPTDSINFQYVKRNKITTPYSSSLSFAAGEFKSFQISQKPNVKMTINSSNASVVIYDAYNSSGRSMYLGTSPTSLVIPPDGTTDEVCFVYLNTTFVTKTSTISVTETAYTMPSTVSISNGQTITGSLASTNPWSVWYPLPCDTYAFSATAGQIVTITMNCLTLGDSFLYLLTSDKNLYALDSTGSTSSTITVEIPLTSTYYIQCSTAWTEQYGTYTVSLSI